MADLAALVNETRNTDKEVETLKKIYDVCEPMVCETRKDFVTAGGATLLLDSLDRVWDTTQESEELVTWLFFAICSCRRERDAMEEAERRGFAPRVLLSLQRKKYTGAMFLASACAAVRGLAFDLDTCRDYFDQNGAIALILEARLVDPNLAMLHIQVGASLRNLACGAEVIRDHILDSGGLEAVMASSESLPNVPKVHEEALATLRNVACGASEKGHRVSLLGGIEYSVTMLKTHFFDEKVVEQGFAALWSIVHGSSIRAARCCELGALELLLSCCARHEAAERVAENCCGALLNIIHENEEHKKRAVELGTVPFVVKLARIHCDSSAVLRTAGNALWNLAMRSEERTSRVVLAGGAEVLLDALPQMHFLVQDVKRYEKMARDASSSPARFARAVKFKHGGLAWLAMGEVVRQNGASRHLAAQCAELAGVPAHMVEEISSWPHELGWVDE